MWGTRCLRALRVTACSHSSSFFELYGRTPEASPSPDEEIAIETKSSVLTSSSCIGGKSTLERADADWTACRAALQRVQTRLYTDPKHVPPELPRAALTAMATVLTTSPLRRSSAAHTFWKDALELRALTPAVDIDAAADAAAVLLSSGKATAGYEVCQRLVQHAGARKRLEAASDVEGSLRLLSVWVLCGSGAGHQQLPASSLTVVEAVLRQAKATIAAAEKSQRAGLAHAVEILAWSLDSLYGGVVDGEAAETLHSVRPLLPQWLLFLFEPFSNAAAEQSSASFALLPPRWLRAMAARAGVEGDHSTLEKLLRHAQRVEATSPTYRLFQLSTYVAGVLVSTFPRHPAAPHAVEAYGTALPRDALHHYGSTREGFGAAVKVLSAMAGPEPYFVLRELMQQQSPEAAAATQEASGDVLTGTPQLNWSAALRFMTREVAEANPEWRSYLPATLRLLSDAGRTRQFFALLAEYNPADATMNVSVAASLAQAMCRSGRWWHAMEVVDLIAAAPPPRSPTEEGMLAAACADTLRALQLNRRWREALDVLTMVGDVVPKHETAVVSQLLTSLPSEAPWEASLLLAEEKGFSVLNTGAVLRVLHGRGVSEQLLQLSRPQRRVAVPLLAQQGRWQPLFELAQQQESAGDLSVWLSLLHSLECCADEVAEASGKLMVSSLPPALAEDARTFRVVTQLCLQRGWKGVLDAYLASTAASSSRVTASLSKEYRYLADYVYTGARPPLTFVFTDTYVIHRFVSAVAARQLSVLATLPDAAAVSKKAASAYLRVPYENLGTPQKRRDASSSSSAPSVKVYAAAASAFLPEHVLHLDKGSGFLFGYKVAGANLFAAARGALQTLRLSGIYSLAYNMSAASSGVFVLQPATTPLRCYTFALRVRLCLAHRPDAPFVPLLATSFFSLYSMTWLAGTTEWNEVAAAVFAESGAEVRSLLRTLKRDINAEGWGLVETEAGAGDLYHVTEVQCTLRASKGSPQVHADGAVAVTCGPRSLKPLNADANAASWWDEV